MEAEFYNYLYWFWSDCVLYFLAGIGIYTVWEYVYGEK